MSRSPSAATIPASLLLPLLLLVACGPPMVAPPALPRAGLAPLERPEILLSVDDFPVEPGSSEGFAFRLPLVSSGYVSLASGEEGDEAVAFTLEFQADAKVEPGAPRHRLALIMAPELLPQLDRGELYEVVFFQNHRGIFLPPAQGVIVRDAAGELVYLLSSDEGVPLEQLPGGLRMLPARTVAFTTAQLSLSGCRLLNEHHFVELQQPGERKQSLAPGESRTIETDGPAYRFVLFDCSISEEEVECMAESPPHFTYLLRRIR